MTNFEFITVPAIAAIVYTVIDIVKTATGGSETFKRFIPLIAAALGGIAGLVAFYTIPDMMGVSNALIAIIIGAASGLSATGTNQVVKQLTGVKVTTNSEGTDKSESK